MAASLTDSVEILGGALESQRVGDGAAALLMDSLEILTGAW